MREVVPKRSIHRLTLERPKYHLVKEMLYYFPTPEVLCMDLHFTDEYFRPPTNVNLTWISDVLKARCPQTLNLTLDAIFPSDKHFSLECYHSRDSAALGGLPNVTVMRHGGINASLRDTLFAVDTLNLCNLRRVGHVECSASLSLSAQDSNHSHVAVWL